MPSDEELAWTNREIEYPSRNQLHQYREERAFILVEDTFRNTFYRFELGESERVQAFLNDPEWGPSSYAVHLIGAVIDMTEIFKAHV